MKGEIPLDSKILKLGETTKDKFYEMVNDAKYKFRKFFKTNHGKTICLHEYVFVNEFIDVPPTIIKGYIKYSYGNHDLKVDIFHYDVIRRCIKCGKLSPYCVGHCSDAG